MRRLGLFLAGLLLVGLLFAESRSLGPVPPLRPLIDPWTGAWGLAAPGPRDASEFELSGLEAPVEIRIDHRGVPHVFAASERDAWRAQGWLVARDRLFQLNLQVRATAGTLTEWVGERALDADRQSRALGLARTAERLWAELAPDDPSRLAMEAYAEGVNAWVEALPRGVVPLEHRLLGVVPDRWLPQYSMYLVQQMGTVLSLGDVAARRARVAALVGWQAADALLPRHSPIQEPIQPNGQLAARTDPPRLPPPGSPDSAAQVLARVLRGLEGTLAEARQAAGDALGSNNWAVMPARTAGGHALLSGDPHLSLTLPSIWYEVHLVVPGRIDVAGATLPGAPGVVIGFNRDLAWSVTNTGADVMDYYRETVDDSRDPRRYRLDGEWAPLVLEEAVYRDRRGRVVAVDTLRFNHRGPVRLSEGQWLSQRWTLAESTPDPHVYIRLNRAADTEAGLAAVAGFVGPAQNFILADRNGRIAIRSTGLYPLRPGDGRGDVVRDGSLRASDWLGWLPVDRYPGARNPAQGFLASANQEPVDPREVPAYLGADWPEPWRAIRINSLLRADSAVTPEAMRRFQTDPGSAAADRFVPAFRQAAAAALVADPERRDLAQAARLLAEWDQRYTVDNRRAVLFEQALVALRRLVWDELIPAADSAPEVAPGQDILAALLEEPASPWWDDRRTTAVEDRDAILAAALEQGLARATARHGPPDGPGWTWSGIRQMNVHHLLRLPPLSRLGVPIASGTGTLSPSAGGGTHGASWRMVVELGPEVRAWTTYPGGQSGNPASRDYADRLPAWTAGDLAEASFPRDPQALGELGTRVSLRLAPAGRP